MNKTIVYLIMAVVLCSFASAETYFREENTNWVYEGVVARTSSTGIKILTHQEFTITNMTKDSHSTATTCNVTNSDHSTTIAEGTFTGDTCILDTPILFSDATTYYLLVDKEGASFSTAYTTGTGDFTGSYAEWVSGFLSGSHSDSQSDDIYAIGGYTGIITDVNVTLVFPEDNNTISSHDLTYNVTVGMDNCTLWINDSGTFRRNQTNLTDHITPNFNHTFEADEFPESNYIWNVQCYNGSDEYWGATNYTFAVDVTPPTITFESNNFFNVNNLTTINGYLTNATLNVTFFDLNLDQILVNISNSSNDVIFLNNSLNLAASTATVGKILNISQLGVGTYVVRLGAGDSHTQQSINPYDTKKGFTYVEYDTKEDIKIRVTSSESLLSVRDIETTKLRDRYIFDFEFWNAKTDTTFRLTSDAKLYYLKDSDYNGHFVTYSKTGFGGNWIDFNSVGLTNKNYQITKVNDYNYDIKIINVNQKKFNFESIGGLNTIEADYQFELTGVFNVSAYDSISNQSLAFTSLLNGTTLHSNNYGPGNQTQYINLTSGTHTLVINVSGYDVLTTTINITQQYQNTTFNMYQTNTIDDCTTFSQKIITFVGKDEKSTDRDVNMTLDITVFHSLFINSSITNNLSFEFKDGFNYSICTNTNQTFLLDAIMEYGDGTEYTYKKYYLNNYIANSSITNIVNLYHLNNSKASEITFTVFDSTTGDKVSEAYIKILRYYPGENVYKIVEIAKTDELGQSLGKMVLADVFYKFIIEVPAGTVKLSTGVLRVLSLTRSFGISFVTDVLDTWDKIHDVSYSTTCTKGTKTCRVTWSDSSNTVKEVTLEVWRITGLADQMLFSQTTVAAAGTIFYAVVEDTTGNTYEARAFAKSNPNWGFGRARFSDPDSPFFTDPTHRIASLFPLFLLVLCITFALIDWGTVGIVVGSLIGLILGSIIGVLPIDPFYIISFVLLAVILIYRLSK